MKDYSKTQAKVVLPSVRKDKQWTRSQLLVAATDDIPICLDHPRVDFVVDLEIDTTPECHGETGFVHIKVVEAKDWLQLWTVNINLLDRNAKQRMCKRLECWSIGFVVLELNSTEEVLKTRVDCSASLWSGVIIFTKV